MAKKKKKPPLQNKTVAPQPDVTVASRGKFPTYLPHAVIALSVIAFYFPLLIGKYWPWDDALDQHYANVGYAVQQLQQGVFPWWNSFCFGGMSYAGDMQTCLFYPVHWLMLLPQVLFGMSFVFVQWYVVAHIVWMGIGMYYVLRDYGFDQRVCTLGGLALALSSHITGHYFHFIIIYVTAWMPWTFWFFRKTLCTQQWKYVFWTGLCLGLSMLGGFAQYSVHFFYFLGVYGVFHILSNQEYKSKQWVQSIARMAPIFGLAVGLAAVQYLLTLETAAYSPRADITYEFSAESSMWPGRLITLFVPNHYGNVNGMNHGRGVYWGEVGLWMHWEAQIYMGLALLIFAIVGFRYWQSRERFLMGGIAGLVILAALAHTFPVYKLLFYVVPVMNRFRGPCRSLYYLPFCLTIVAGAGMDQIVRQDRLEFKHKVWRGAIVLAGLIGLGWVLHTVGFFKGSNPILETGHYHQAVIAEWGWQFLIAALTAGALYLWVQDKQSTFMIVILMVVFWLDLYRAHGRFNYSTITPEHFYPIGAVPNVVREYQPGALQVFQNEGKTELFRVNSRVGHRMALNKNQGMVHQVYTLQGNNQMRPQKLIDMEEHLPLERGWDLYNVKYGIYCSEADKPCNWGRRSGYVPRFWFADSFEVSADSSHIFSMLANNEFPFKSKVFVNEAMPDFVPSPFDSSQDRIETVQYTSSHITLDVQCSGPKLLIGSEHFFPAWCVRVNGKKQKMYMADHTFWAIPLPQGKHRVEFYFSSPAFQKGFLITLLSWVLVMGGLVGTYAMERKRKT